MLGLYITSAIYVVITHLEKEYRSNYVHDYNYAHFRMPEIKYEVRYTYFDYSKK